ncbi:hypothetical protein EV401DRAFT_1943688, partial [Pisolithus croceorrhizus]
MYKHSARVRPSPQHTAMISHQTLYNLANYLGALAMITVVAYHFVAVNARYISANGQGG